MVVGDFNVLKDCKTRERRGSAQASNNRQGRLFKAQIKLSHCSEKILNNWWCLINTSRNTHFKNVWPLLLIFKRSLGCESWYHILLSISILHSPIPDGAAQPDIVQPNRLTWQSKYLDAFENWDSQRIQRNKKRQRQTHGKARHALKATSWEPPLRIVMKGVGGDAESIKWRTRKLNERWRSWVKLSECWRS